MLEGDSRFSNYQTSDIINIKNKLAKKYKTDLEETIATQRYSFIENIKKDTVVKRKKRDTSACISQKFLI